MTKVALSGAGGNIGQVLRPALLERGVDLRSAGGPQPLEPLRPGEDLTYGDLRDPAVVDRLLAGVDVLIHMAGTSVERPLPEIIENNLVGLHQVYEGARRHGVKRIVFASSNHAIGMHPVEEKLDPDCDFRPDGFYGLSKMWGEGMARMYWDKHGIEGVSVRIGSAIERPTEFRQLSTWFGLEDLSRSPCAASRRRTSATSRSGACRPTRAATGGRSAASGSAGGRSRTRRTTRPRSWRKPNPLSPVAQRFQGGAFVAMDYTPPERRPG